MSARTRIIRRRARRLRRYLSAERRTLTQGFVALFISSGGDLLAGLALSFMDHQLNNLAGLVVLIPAAIGMRGNIFGALGSRLGTGINAGQFEPSLRRKGFLGQNVQSSWYLTLATCLFLGLAAHIVAIAFGERAMSVSDFLTISILGGVLGSVVVGAATVGVAIVSHRHRWDLDSVSAPIVTAIGDVATLPALWLASLVVQHFSGLTPYLGAGMGALCLIGTVWGWRERSPLIRRIVRQSMAVLFIAGLIDLVAGTLIEGRLASFTAAPALLILVPPFLEDTNALSGILSSRINSKLHIGALEPTPWPQALAWIDIAINFVFAASVFFMVGASADLVARVTQGVTHKASPSFAMMIAISLSAGFLATIISCAVAYYSAIATFRFGWDPDNFSIPISSAVMDVAGVLCLILVILLFGVNAHG
jgi:mgtE-like transporter